ncbi:MAG: DUF3301 domain-containing protein [Xanthomonadales bacterium]|nr:DUF3301 domain-containing protein [Xanthomonadales bacterium]
MIELFIFLLVTACVVAWWQLMQGRQKARRAAGQVCGNHGLQLLDDTVSLSSVTWNRDNSNSRIEVNYGFEFAINGAKRRSGVTTIGFPASLSVTLDLEDGRLIENLGNRQG